jgi:hypothetical protein
MGDDEEGQKKEKKGNQKKRKDFFIFPLLFPSYFLYFYYGIGIDRVWKLEIGN